MTPGFFPDVDEASYHSDTGSLSHSGAKLILRSPALFRYRQEHPEVKGIFDYGSAAHALVLGQPIEDLVYVAPYDDWRTKAAQAEQQIARDAGRAPILPKDWLQVCDMAEQLAGHPEAAALLSGGASEVSAYAEDDQTGVTLRCRYDYLTDRWATDYKTAVDANPRRFGDVAARYGYDSQDAWYRRIAELLGHPLVAFAFVCQEKSPPYLVSVNELPPELRERGRIRNRRAIDTYAECVRTGEWPGYPGFQTVSAPRWALYEEGIA